MSGFRGAYLKKTLFTLQYPEAETSQALNGICEALIHGDVGDGEKQVRNESI